MALALPIRADKRRKNAPKAVSVRPTVTAASRNSDAARLLLRRVAEDRIFPPEILLRGANESQEVKVFGARPRGEIGSALADQLERQIRAEPMNLRQIDSEHRIKSIARGEVGSIGLF